MTGHSNIHTQHTLTHLLFRAVIIKRQVVRVDSVSIFAIECRIFMTVSPGLK